jgi:hypothetical protein
LPFQLLRPAQAMELPYLFYILPVLFAAEKLNRGIDKISDDPGIHADTS